MCELWHELHPGARRVPAVPQVLRTRLRQDGEAAVADVLRAYWTHPALEWARQTRAQDPRASRRARTLPHALSASVWDACVTALELGEPTPWPTVGEEGDHVLREAYDRMTRRGQEAIVRGCEMRRVEGAEGARALLDELEQVAERKGVPLWA